MNYGKICYWESVVEVGDFLHLFLLLHITLSYPNTVFGSDYHSLVELISKYFILPQKDKSRTLGPRYSVYLFLEAQEEQRNLGSKHSM